MKKVHTLITLTFLAVVFQLLACRKDVRAQQPVKNIVLVHGAFADGSGFQALYNILKKKGFTVSVAGNPNTGFKDDVDAVNRVLARQDGKALLVGHSYGGAIITEAGNHPKVAGLVYIAAFAPDANETLLKLIESGPPTPKSGILPPDEFGFVWYDLKKFHAGFAGDLPLAQAEFLADSQVPVSASVFGASIASPAWKKHKTWYIVATEDETISPAGERAMAKRMGAKVTEIKASHLVFMSKPDSVAAVIEAAIKEISK